MTVTIVEIAEIAGVSRATVSRYLNDGYVSKDKAEKIKKAIEETGYQPSRQAQMLRTKKTNLIGVIIPRLNSASVSRMVDGISLELRNSGYETLLANTNNHENDELKYLKLFATNQSVDGVILVGSILTDKHKKVLRDYPLPIVVLSQYTDLCSCVYYDDYQAAKTMTELLLKKGTNVGYIGVTERDEAAGKSRCDGYLDALKDAGKFPDPTYMKTAGFNMEDGYKAARDLYSKKKYPDALFCATDNIAIGAMLYLKEIGLRIPEDVQVTGIGDTQGSRIVQPTLTTMHYYYKTAGSKSADMLVKLVSKEEIIKYSVKMSYELVMNQSTKAVE